MPATKNEKELPSTIQRSDSKAKRTWAKAHDSAVETYGEGQRAHRVAYSALKHTHEKRGDRWVPKGRKGPSDPQAAQSMPASRSRPRSTAGGVDVLGNSKQELMDRARKMDISGRSRMNKDELAKAIASKQRQADRRKR
ncbi:MAG TPA: ChaB family protein [Actinomycetes bacterium]|jgi:cation transport regulator ChaB|nr:ChaB family protein [Actinomycetes bacterium]